jgi:hypothetical protein
VASARPDGRGVSALLIARSWMRRSENVVVAEDCRDFISSASGYACGRSLCEGMKGDVSHAACVLVFCFCLANPIVASNLTTNRSTL